MYSKFVAVIITMLIACFCTAGHAQEVDLSKFTMVTAGMVVPFDGVLLSPEAMAKVLTDAEFALEQLKLEHRYKLLEMEAFHAMEKDKLHASLDIERRSCEERIDLVENRYEKLLQAHGKQNMGNLERALWGGGGFLIGAGTAVGITYIIMSVGK